MFARTLWVVRRGDLVFLVTNPPLLPLFALLACRVRGARCCLRIDDVYPEAMVHAGLIRPGGILASIANWANRRLYRRMDRIIVLGRDMKRLVEEKLGYAGDKVLVIPNWADTDSVAPAERCQNRFLAQYGLQGKFVVGYAGNIGRVQAVESLFEAASLLEGRPELHFLVFGSGQKVSWLARAVAAAQLTNLTLAGLRSRAEQAEMLNAFDVGAIALVRGMAGAGVPSRLYNLMAAGRPVLAALDAESEVAQVVREEKIGWVVPPDEPQKLAGAILEASSNRERLKAMGARARKAAEEKYSAARILGLYERVLGGKT
jgi:glycosyltransferase involved in cell wall biosynthesis